MEGMDGNLYGTTYQGGTGSCTYGCGTIFKMNITGSTLTTLHSFVNSDGANPWASLTQGTDGNLYGTTLNGGTSGSGTIFKIDTSGATFTALHSFAGSDGAEPYAGLIQGSDGNLYGTTSVGGTNGNGTIFKIDTNGATLTTLHSFAYSDGRNPTGGLIQCTDGNLYGTTTGGGANSEGTIFKIDTNGSTLTTLHSFAYADGAYPQAGLIQGTDGNLYGTTYQGGTSEYGTIFKIDTSGSTFTTLHSFANSDGTGPNGLIQATDGNLYGTTGGGGANGYGTIFKIDINGTAFTTLHSFVNSDGANPYAGLIQGTDGNLYGTTAWGGTNGSGTILKIDTNGTTLTTLHSFVTSDGADPQSSLIQGADGYLYGTTYQGGANGPYGTIFKTDTNGSTFTSLHSFAYYTGGYPYAGLIQGTDGNLYGTTTAGGANGYGTIFKIDTNGTTLTTLHSFTGSDGAEPYAGLIQGTDGNLYGTTRVGGTNGYGTIFKIDTNGTALTTLHSFVTSAYPFASLMQGADGYLYGTTAGGGSGDNGTIFKINTNGSIFTTLHRFTFTDGALPSAELVQAADGNLYGNAAGGPTLGGVVFRLILSGAPFEVVGVAPTSGPSSGGTYVSVSGLGFESTDTVSLSGAAATSVIWVNPSQINATTPGLLPGTLNDIVVTKLNLSSAQLSRGFLADFLDVPQSDNFHDYVEKIFRSGITAGCGGGNYCPNDPVTRAQMAVFLLRAEHGSSYVPPPCTGIFADVACTPVPAFAADWIEQLSIEGITAGCGGGNYCPDQPVTRAQMAVFLLRAEHGPGYAPPACTAPGIFGDVPCPGGFAVDWIERLYAEGVTGGCSSSPPLYCPDNPNTRGQMAVFLAKAFGL
jgi:uncharacterized repeat protein (TIGR03803 family)